MTIFKNIVLCCVLGVVGVPDQVPATVDMGRIAAAGLPVTGNTHLFVLVFLSPDCPLCRNYTKVLNELAHQYQGKLTLYGIVPGKTVTAADLQQFSSTYHLAFPLLRDPAKKLTNLIHATITPEAILMNKEGKILYSGLIDNWVIDLGKQRAAPTQQYLKDAVDTCLSGRSVVITRTKAIGCFIDNY
jgi:thiol-disulfide isomerase/thioredoxin